MTSSAKSNQDTTWRRFLPWVLLLSVATIAFQLSELHGPGVVTNGNETRALTEITTDSVQFRFGHVQTFSKSLALCSSYFNDEKDSDICCRQSSYFLPTLSGTNEKIPLSKRCLDHNQKTSFSIIFNVESGDMCYSRGKIIKLYDVFASFNIN